MLIEGWQGGSQPGTRLLAESIPARASCLLGSNPEGKTFLTPLPNPIALGDSFPHVDLPTRELRPGIRQQAQCLHHPGLGRAFPEVIWYFLALVSCV